jgi:hypothetical protein
MSLRRVGLLSSFLLAAPVYAGPAEDAARTTFEEGLAEESRGSAAACEKFRKALELIREVGPLKKVKECDARENKLRAARDKLRELVDRWPVQDAELEGFKTELAAIEDRIPRLTLTAKADAPAGMKVRVDAIVVPLPANELELDPGEHEVLAEADGLPLSRTPVTLAPGERKTLELTMARPTQPPPTVAPTESGGLGALGVAGIAIGSVGVAGLIGGAITGGLVLATQSDYEACTVGCGDLQDRGNTLNLVNAVFFVAGAATAVLGGTLLVIDLTRSPTTDSALHLGPGRADWVVRF